MESNSPEDVLAWVREKFVEVRLILENVRHTGESEKEPYKQQYAALEILKETQKSLSNVYNTIDSTKNKDVVTWMLAVVYLNMGLLYTNTEELKAGEEQFMNCLDILKGKELKAEGIIPTLSALNQLGIIWSQWNQPEKAKNFLDRAEQLYKDYTSEETPVCDPVSMVTHFGIADDEGELSTKEVVEKLHTLTLYYLAQVYSMIKDHHKSAIYCHMTLRRQLGKDGVVREDLDYIDWALNAATLSQYFMENEGITQARHHLAAATYIMQKSETKLKSKTQTEGESEALSAEWTNFNHRKADIARCWAKYGILLLSMSKQRLMQKAEKDDDEDTKSKTDVEKKVEQSQIYDDLKFEMLEQDITSIANQITDKYLLDFNDARAVFLNVQKWLDEAREFYSLDGHTSDYVQIEQDMSQAYKYLTFYEESEDRQAKMHKRRVDILENLIKELSPQYYQAACRQIWIELGETYSDILDIKLDRLRATDDRPTPQALTKINHLTRNAIKNFQCFLDSLKIQSTNSMPEQFSEDLTYPALCAYFHIGRLYNKIITPDKSLQLENTQKSIEAYKFVVDYCDKYPKAAELMKVELNISRDLVNLLPMKINKLRQELMGCVS